MNTVDIRSQVDTEELVQSVCDSLGKEDLLDFILAIDSHMGDWEFSLLLLEWLMDSLYEDADEDGMQDLKKAIQRRAKKYHSKRSK